MWIHSLVPVSLSLQEVVRREILEARLVDIVYCI